MSHRPTPVVEWDLARDLRWCCDVDWMAPNDVGEAKASIDSSRRHGRRSLILWPVYTRRCVGVSAVAWYTSYPVSSLQRRSVSAIDLRIAAQLTSERYRTPAATGRRLVSRRGRTQSRSPTLRLPAINNVLDQRYRIATNSTSALTALSAGGLRLDAVRPSQTTSTSWSSARRRHSAALRWTTRGALTAIDTKKSLTAPLFTVGHDHVRF